MEATPVGVTARAEDESNTAARRRGAADGQRSDLYLYPFHLSLDAIPKEYRSRVHLCQPGIAYMVGQGQEHVIVHAGMFEMGVIVLGSGGSGNSSNSSGAFRSYLEQNGLWYAIRKLPAPVAYAMSYPPKDSRLLSALVGFTVDSFFPHYGPPGEEARAGLEAAMANPAQTLERIMSGKGYKVEKL